ncbi:MAG: hypothetical protein OEO84_08825 [Betaproteobacteria bacterium]|nr:hypothetical protein [Betaproteobacteria bacterium]
MRAWLALALVCWLLPAWAQAPAPTPTQKKRAARPAPVKRQKAQKAHRQASPEQIRRFNELQKKQGAKR